MNLDLYIFIVVYLLIGAVLNIRIEKLVLQDKDIQEMLGSDLDFMIQLLCGIVFVLLWPMFLVLALFVPDEEPKT